MGSVPERTPLDSSFAIQASDNKAVVGLLNNIGTLGASFSPDDNDARLKLLKEARQLVQALETPRETMVKHLWAQVGCFLVYLSFD